ncbi:MAG: DUF5693 family protein, partial [Clostridiales bacterium]|nr:DUF5693 family protein [Clostridiales bacterium]
GDILTLSGGQLAFYRQALSLNRSDTGVGDPGTSNAEALSASTIAPAPDKTYILTKDQMVYAQIWDMLSVKRRYPEVYDLPGYLCIAVSLSSAERASLGLGFPLAQLEEAAAEGLEIIPRIRNWEPVREDSLAAVFQWVEKIPNLAGIGFNDMSVPGGGTNPVLQDLIAQSMIPLDKPLISFEFYDQAGLPGLAARMDNRVLRAHAIAENELRKYANVRDAMDRFNLAATERNIRYIYLRFYGLENPAASQMSNMELISTVREGLAGEGLTIGSPEVIPSFSVPFACRYITGVGVIVAGIWILAMGAAPLLGGKAWTLCILLFVAGCGVWGLLLAMAPGLGGKLMALAGSILFPSLGILLALGPGFGQALPAWGAGAEAQDADALAHDMDVEAHHAGMTGISADMQDVSTGMRGADAQGASTSSFTQVHAGGLSAAGGGYSSAAAGDAAEDAARFADPEQTGADAWSIDEARLDDARLEADAWRVSQVMQSNARQDTETGLEAPGGDNDTYPGDRMQDNGSPGSGAPDSKRSGGFNGVFNGEFNGGRFGSIARVSILFLAISIFTLAGAMIMSALLASPSYMLKLDSFVGVKIAHLAPLLLIPFVLWLWEKERIRLLTDTAESSLRVWQLAAGLILLAGLAIYILRTGNESLGTVSDLEMQIRQYLDRILTVRPRTKEFLIGHPAMMILLYFGYRFERLPILAIGAIGQISLINTYAHIHTPLAISLLRSVHGLWIGILLGVIAITIILWIRPWLVKGNQIYEGGANADDLS